MASLPAIGMFSLNHVYNSTIDAASLQALTGTTPDISPILRFFWWQPVYYKIDDSDFPSESREGRGHWVGIAENVGHAMTFKILTDDTRKTIYRSNICPVNDSAPNYCLDLLCGEDLLVEPKNLEDPLLKPILKDQHDKFLEQSKDDPDSINDNTAFQMAIINPSDLVGRTFLMPERDDGQRFRAQIIETIQSNEEKFHSFPDHIKL